jgi:type IV pilus assembly protein PilA
MLNYDTTRHRCRVHGRGFTVIELIIIVMAVAVLVAFAVPVYKEYGIRAKVSKCLDSAVAAKLSISGYYNTIGSWPPDAESASLNDNGRSEYCNGFVAYDSARGAFQVDVNEKALGQGSGRIQPELAPQITSSGTIEWHCSLAATAPLLEDYLPSECREN